MSRWLAGLRPDELAAILVRRPEASTAPVPRTLGDVAARLSQQHHVGESVTTLCLPAIQVLETAQALLPDGAASIPLAELAALLGREPGDAELAAALEVLYQRALAWPVDDQLVLSGPLRYAFAYPLRLGRPAAALLGSRPVDEIRRIGANLGARGLSARAKRDVIDAVAARLAEPETVRDVVAGAPAELAQILHSLANRSPVVQGEHGYLPGVLDWAIERGLLVTDGWQFAEMPREVALCMRGPEWRAPFVAHPPLPPLPVADRSAVAREAAAAATALLSGVAAVIDSAPIAPLKAGGVGAREMKRLSKATGIGEFEIGFYLELAGAAGLVQAGYDEVLPTPEYDAWAAAPPAERLSALVQSWLELPTVRLPSNPPLRPEHTEPARRRLRTTLLSVLGEISGALPADGALVHPLLAWHAPLALDNPGEETSALLSLTLWREATVLGVVARGALSPLGRAALDGTDVAAAAAGMVTAPSDRAVFQADLTAVVSGTPSVEVSRLLDSCADREARGAASIWRFTPASVRRALDAGITADDLVERLSGVGTVPQALQYVIGDVARRHGALRVRAVGCVLHGLDPILLKEAAADRRLSALRLSVIAPTVLSSARPPAETLAALRTAGYAPVAEDASGTPLAEVPPQRRAEQPIAVRRIRRQPGPPRASDALALATKLLATGIGRADEGRDGGGRQEARRGASTLAGHLSMLDDTILRNAAPQLGRDEIHLLQRALHDSGRVHIEYLSAEGYRSQRTIEPLEIEDGNLLRAYCLLRSDERYFALARIKSVEQT
jgi:hypothetical protein